MTEFQALVILMSRAWMLNDKNIELFLGCTLDNLNSIQRYYSIHKVVLYLVEPASYDSFPSQAHFQG